MAGSVATSQKRDRRPNARRSMARQLAEMGMWAFSTYKDKRYSDRVDMSGVDVKMMKGRRVVREARDYAVAGAYALRQHPREAVCSMGLQANYSGRK